MDESPTPVILVVEENATVRRCTVRAFEVVGIVVDARDEMPLPESIPIDMSLVLFDCSRPSDALWAAVRAWSEETSTALLPVTVRPGDFPAEIQELRGVDVPLDKPYTPYQLCRAALALAPELRGEDDPLPFPAEPPTALMQEQEIDVELESAQDIIELLREDLGVTQATDPIHPLDEPAAGGPPKSVEFSCGSTWGRLRRTTSS
jgi:CheY-like chemotaxis protein